MRSRIFSTLVLALLLTLLFGVAALGCSKPIISSITPNTGYDDQVVKVGIDGTRFHKSAQVMLAKDGAADIIAANITVISKEKITCEFDLKKMPVGKWNLVVSNVGTFTKKLKTAVLTEAFTILPSAPSIASVEPKKAFNDAVVALIIKGANFKQGTTFKIVLPGKEEILSTGQTIKSVGEAEATFNLSNLTPGEYDLVVINQDSQTGTLAKAFIVEAAPVPTPPTVIPTAAPEAAKQPAAPVDPNSLLVSIFFDFDMANIRDDQMQSAENNLKILKQYAVNNYIVLGGHADERGPNNYNIALSGRRAETIKQYLTANGIDSAKIVIYAYGEDNPTKSGHTEESWSYNRRVDLAVWQTLPTKDAALKQ